MPATELEDDESVLDISEQTNRPNDVALAQQRIPAWHPILDPVWVIIALFYLGAILVPVGTSCHPALWMCSSCPFFGGIVLIRFGVPSFLRQASKCRACKGML